MAKMNSTTDLRHYGNKARQAKGTRCIKHYIYEAKSTTGIKQCRYKARQAKCTTCIKHYPFHLNEAGTKVLAKNIINCINRF